MVCHNLILRCHNILSVHDWRCYGKRLHPWHIHDSLFDPNMGFHCIRHKQEKHSGKLRPVLHTTSEKMHIDHFASINKL